PVLCGPTTDCIATAAIAASIALPPDRNMSSPAIVAIGAEVATMPFAATAAERPGTEKSRIIVLDQTAVSPRIPARSCGAGQFAEGAGRHCPQRSLAGSALAPRPGLGQLRCSFRDRDVLMDGSLIFPVAEAPPPGTTIPIAPGIRWLRMKLP